MATNTSEHLGLNLWEPDDQVLREEFNENWEKLDEETADIRADLTEGLAAADTALTQAQQTLTQADQTLTQNLAVLAANVGSGGQNARIAWGSYTGTGTYGKTSPSSLTFEFYPVIVIVGCDQNSTAAYNPTIMFRGRTKAHADTTDTTGSTMSVQWTDNGVSWYSTSSASLQNNTNTSYCYVAIGYDNTTEQ